MACTVVTGIGVVAPSGIGVAEHWTCTLHGKLRVRPIERFDPTPYGTVLAGQVPDFRPEDFVDDRLRVQTDRWTWFALAQARLALDDAGYDPSGVDPYATSVILGSASGGNEFGQQEIAALWSRSPRAVSAYQSIAWFYAASTGQVSIRHGTKGPAGVIVSDAAGGLDSIGHASRAIGRGTPAVLAGGAEAPLSPYALTCQLRTGRLTAARDARDGYKPFDRLANGYAPGEGGAVLLLEDAAVAASRGAPVHGEIAGYAATHDAYHHRRPAPDARQYARAIRLAIADAGLTADEVDLVIADGAGSPDLDRLEAEAIHRAFGERAAQLPVTAPQGLVGRLCSGGAPLNVATALLAIRDRLAPPTGNLDEPDPTYRLDLVCGAPRELAVDVVLVLARGYGGFNSALVVRRHSKEGNG